MKISELIKVIRTEVNDLEGIAVSDGWILHAIKDARCEIFSVHPSRFVKNQLLPASIGSLQCVNECCDRLVSVEEITDCKGRHISNISAGNTEQGKKFSKASVKVKEVKNRTFSTNKSFPNQFEVYPPVKRSEDIYFRVVCYSKPELLTDVDSDLPEDCDASNIVLYVKYRFFAIETESVSSRSASSTFLNQFYNSIGARKKERMRVEELPDD